MSTDGAAATSGGAGQADPPAFDTGRARQARVFVGLMPV
jgi:hypothetical protein